MAWTWTSDSNLASNVSIQSSSISSVAESLIGPITDKTAVQCISASLDDVKGQVTLSKSSESGALLTLAVKVQPKDEETEAQLSLDVAQHMQSSIQTVVEEAITILCGKHTGDCCKPVFGTEEMKMESDGKRDPESSNVTCDLWLHGELVSFCQRGQLRMIQPRVARQRHQNACGYHALHNAQLLLTASDALAQGLVPSQDLCTALQSERVSWRQLLADLHILQTKPPDGSKWKPSVIRGCTLDQCHIRHLLSLNPGLSKRVFIVEAEVSAGLGEAKDAIVNLLKGKGDSVALILGCVTHWVAAVVACASDGPILLLADSFNKCLLNSIPSAELAKKGVEDAFPGFVERIQIEMPRYIEAPRSVLEELYETGVPEWWQGQQKSSVYWKHRPAPLRRQLAEMEISAIYAYLDEIEKVIVDKSNL
eukprot:gnl/MRDRNA2_/MRDRNA2_146643_c0_seq1.p1 gnl/MRDRNA2_/MRDRNA2_146643_c0~~gnl/MRDRNA2_/MRDRNA2_146643_c0_seq1.p1  ORF type:complete len:423 (+),score=71.43 gnl/MRDRNA2_/MRDRNA2_146643_c0_seq1:60-1328(+)